MNFQLSSKHHLWSRSLLSRATVFLLTGLLLFLTGCGSLPSVGQAASNPPADRRLTVTDGKLTDSAGNPVQLRGVSTHGIAWFPQYINANAFRSVKETGGNVVRAAMYTDTENGYLANPEYNLTLMCQAIENALALDLYIIVDWHILSDGNPNDHLAEAITFFDAVASRYQDDPHLIYEVCNEPNNVEWEDIKAYAYAIFPVIRQYAPNAVILLGTPVYCADLQGPISDPFPGENFLYTYHAYAGEHMSSEMITAAAEAELPIFVSEWGVGEAMDGSPALEEAEEFLKVMEEHQTSWCAWSLCNKEEVYSLLRPDCSAFGGWAEEDLSDVGKLIFRYLGK